MGTKSVPESLNTIPRNRSFVYVVTQKALYFQAAASFLQKLPQLGFEKSEYLYRALHEQYHQKIQ